MDRQLIYPGQIPLETDLLHAQKNDMIGLSKLAAAMLGTSTMLNGLACTPTAPAGLTVNVAPGEIYSLQNIDGTAYSSLAADTTHQIVKQGISLDTVNLSCPAPGTAGQSINYLVQIAYTDTDADAVVLPYYNASNPTQAYSGPNNAGTTNNTVRKGVCTVAVKAGIAAATGTQTTPAPDSGYVGAWVVTVANGQTTITAGNITGYAGAPFIPAAGLVVGGLQGQACNISAAGGTADAITGSFTPGIAALTNGMKLFVRAASANGTTTPTFTPNIGTIPAKTIVKGAGTALAAGDIAGAGHWLALQYDATLDKLVLMNPATGVSTLTATNDPTFAGNSDKPASTSWVRGAMAAIATAAGFSMSLTANGYIKLPSWLGGLIFQWGTLAAITGGASASFTLPIAFPSTCFFRSAQFQLTSNGTTPTAFATDPGATPLTSFTVRNESTVTSGNSLAFAIGY